ncbi:MAG TPA: endonuclease/exonuclease/phosphatase family protein [Gammaproteobacteria bacterium]|nr:endonuclease/exonuclease/phosphatase family protein [Gammaproteobacteria bacterium]
MEETHSESPYLEPGAVRQTLHDPGPEAHHLPVDRQRLRLLTYNIQVGIETGAYHHYVTRGWRHFLPSPTRQRNLDRIAERLGGYDVVALQEADAGSLRSGNINQVEYLAQRAGFPYWYVQVNRNLRIARHSLGLLTRYRPHSIVEHRLPGLFPGRGAMVVRYGEGRHDALFLVIVHLALGRRSRQRQLEYLRRMVNEHQHVIIMGDMNVHTQGVIEDSPLRHTQLRSATPALASYPSWRPRRGLDHILVSPGLEVHDARALSDAGSDHLPVALDVSLPHRIRLLR